MKQYIGISRDHSGSMRSLSNAAKKDYNETITSIRDASREHDIDTIVSVVSHQGDIKKEVVNSGIDRLKPLTSYPTPGYSTPLFDSVQKLITLLKNVPDAEDKNVSFLVIAVTDGEDNSSQISGRELGRTIRELQSTDRWTFVFRVPRGYARSLESLGIPSGNIHEWDAGDERSFIEATALTSQAVSNYYNNVARGVRSTNAFYANLGHVSQGRAAANLLNISREVEIFPVTRRTEISSFIKNRVGDYEKGKAFYQLSKTEKEVQYYKRIVIRNKKSGKVFAGSEARTLLNLPGYGTIKLVPGDHGDWDIFIQSTSTNRILLPGTSVLYWENA